MGKARNLADSFLYDRDLRKERVYFHPRDFYSLTAGIHFKLIHTKTKLQVFLSTYRSLVRRDQRVRLTLLSL